MKKKNKRILALALSFVMATSALAAEVPDHLVVENLNGQQRIVKTYVLPPEKDPETLKEPSIGASGPHTWGWRPAAPAPRPASSARCWPRP